MGEDLARDDEAALVTRAQSGDTSAFDELITRHREKIYMHICQIVRNDEDALDLTQDVFVRAWRSLGRFDGRASFVNWIYRIATNAAIDLCRRRQVRSHADLDQGPLVPEAGSHTTPAAAGVPGDGLDRAEIRRRIDEAFAELSPEHRAVIVLKEIDDLSYQEIAQRLGCSMGTVMSRLFYARKNLQARLRDLHDEIG